MKTIVVYFSLDGNTKFAAEKIAEELGAELLQLVPVKAFPTGKVSKFFWGGKSASFNEKRELQEYNFKAEDYDRIIIGTPLWAGTITPPMRSFLSENSLAGKKVAAFICCSGGSTGKGFNVLKQEAGCEAFEKELVLVNALKNKETAEKKIGEFCKAMEP